MNDKALEIINLLQELKEHLDDKETIAELQNLHKQHPELFKDMKEIKRFLDEVKGTK